MTKEEMAEVIKQALAQEFAELREAKRLALGAAVELEGCADTLQLLGNPKATVEHVKLHVANLQKCASRIREGIRHLDRRLG